MTPAQSIVITGTSSGIGEACALRLDREGFRVFAGVRSAADGEALARLASARLQPLLLDVTDAASIAAAAAQVADAVGSEGLGGLVNNAGIAAPGPLELVPLSDVRRVLEVNVVGQVATTQAFLPMLRRGRGRVVFMSSIAGRVASPITGVYNGSKFALEAIADAWRMELKGSPVLVSVIQPGTVTTPIWTKNLAAADDLIAAMPDEARTRYGRVVAGVRAWAERSSQRGIPVGDVTDAVLHAIMADRPRTRYVVGRGSRLFVLLRWLPDPLRDRMLLRALGA